MKTITYMQAFNEAVDEEMARDKNVFVLGEDVGKFWGSAYGEYKGLYQKYGAERMRETPISETAIVGAAIGAAACGMRPIAVVMFSDFLGVPGDEILNQLTKMRYMFGGILKLPVVITSYSGAGLQAAAQHSKNLEGMLMSIPGLKIISPATPYDVKGLMKSAIRDDNPVLFLLRQLLLVSGFSGEIPEEEYLIPLGKADIKREGSDVTIVAIGNMVQRALDYAQKAQETQNISMEVIDLRTIIPLDKEAILNSVKKTGKLIIMDEEPKTGSVASEIAAIVSEEALDSLDAPIKRVCAPDTPVPFSPVLEKAWMPDEENLDIAVKEIF